MYVLCEGSIRSPQVSSHTLKTPDFSTSCHKTQENPWTVLVLACLCSSRCPLFQISQENVGKWVWQCSWAWEHLSIAAPPASVSLLLTVTLQNLLLRTAGSVPRKKKQGIKRAPEKLSSMLTLLRMGCLGQCQHCLLFWAPWHQSKSLDVKTSQEVNKFS